jgi:ParB/RepB/Spo0J family partition protein
MTKKDILVSENPKNLLVDKNSRWRADGNLSELMESIKQNGILQPIVARSEDHVVVCGNRRLASAMKLQMNSVPVRFISGISDKELLILNLTENMQRKDVSSIEIGRMCDNMIKNASFKISVAELATALGVSINRIKICLNSFYSLPAEFRDKVIHMDSSRLRKMGDLPENIVACILTFGRQYKKINNLELKYLLKKAADDMMTVSQISLVGKLFVEGMPFKKAISASDKYCIMRIDSIALKTELASAMKKEKVSSKKEFMKKLVNEKYPSLIF